MKSIKIFALGAAVLTTFALTSCDDCVVCVKEGENEQRVCRDDYGSETEYGLALDGFTAAGYDCPSSL